MMFSMSLILIVGPMKSGKSMELISRMSVFNHSNHRPILVQPKLNVRDAGIRSRTGVEVPALKVTSLKEIDSTKYDVIGVDEAFMFTASDAQYIKQWLAQDKIVYVSTLDLSAMGRVPEMVHELYKLAPDEIIRKTAVCENCRALGAQYTQILENGNPAKDLPDVVPEDGTYEYRPACRECFFA
jgi:thymidine kinase